MACQARQVRWRLLQLPGPLSAVLLPWTMRKVLLHAACCAGPRRQQQGGSDTRYLFWVAPRRGDDPQFV